MNLFKYAFLFVAISVSSAHANPSKIIGTWTSDCEALEGSSYQNSVTFLSDGIMMSTDLNYAGGGCHANPSASTSSAPYQVTFEDADSVVIATQPVGKVDGDPVQISAEFKFQDAEKITMKALAAKVLVGGVPTDVPAAEIQMMPVMTYTKH